MVGCGGGVTPSGIWEAGEMSSAGKGPSEAPVIDQKFMSAPGIRPAFPLLAFMCWRGRAGAQERRGGGEDI